MNALMALAAGGYLIAWFLHPQQLMRVGHLAALGVVLVVLPFTICYALWGVTYVRKIHVHTDDTGVAL